MDDDPGEDVYRGIGNVKIKQAINICAWFFVPVTFISTFVGLVEFFFISTLIILTILVTLFTYTVADWPDLPLQSLWFLYLLPFMELLLSMCFDISKSFFDELWEIASPQAVRRYLSDQLKTFGISTSIASKVFICAKLLWLVFCLFFIVLYLAWSLIAFFVIEMDPPDEMSMVYGVYCFLTPILCVFLVVMRPWVLSFPKPLEKMRGKLEPRMPTVQRPSERPPDTYARRATISAPPPALFRESDSGNDRENSGTARANRRLSAVSGGKDAADPAAAEGNEFSPSLFDPCALRKQRLWKTFVKEQFDAFFGKLLFIQRPRLVIVFGFTAMAVVLISLDVRREFLVLQDNTERSDVLGSFRDYLHDYAQIQNVTYNVDAFDPWVGVPDIELAAIEESLSYAELAIRSIWIVLTLPFTICTSPASYYMAKALVKRSTKLANIFQQKKSPEEDAEEEEDYGMGGRAMSIFMTLGVIILLIGIVLIIAALIFRALFTPFQIKQFGWIDPTWERVTNSTPALMCGTQINGWGLIDFAALPVMLDLIPDSLFTSFSMGRIGGAYAQAAAGWDRDDIVASGTATELEPCEAVYRSLTQQKVYPLPVNETDDEMLERLGGRTFLRDFGTESLFGLRHAQLFRDGFEARSLIGYAGIRSADDVGISLETVWTYWFRELMDMLIPYYGMVAGVFLDAFWDSLTEQIVTLFYGPNRMSWRLASRFQADAALRVAWANFNKQFGSEEVQQQMDHNLVYIGHGASGLFVKGLAMQFKQYGVALESGQFELSPPSTTFIVTGEGAEWSLLNVYSGTSVLSMPEEAAKGNLKLPDVASIWKPADIYETFCIIAAGCVTDDSFDSLCSEVVGLDTYQWYFRSWGRPRLDDDQ
jgi:hypothetical protein